MRAETASEMILYRSHVSLIPDYTVEKIRRAKSGEEKGFFQINGKQEDFPRR